MLGKRKRDLAVVRHSSATNAATVKPADQQQDLDHDIFRKHFEAMFDPLPVSLGAAPSRDEDVEDEIEDLRDEDSDSSEWSGISASQHAPADAAIEIVEHRTHTESEEDIDLERLHYKTFMTSRPPKEVERARSKGTIREVDEKEDGSEALNLKHDIDLQRLLKESHLLEQAKASSGLGVHRHKAVDMRLQTLGSKGSMFQQEKMPLAHRKGILAKSAVRDASRRKEAKDNGIILEKASGKSRVRDLRRERTVDVPTVGKFRGGTLRLSKKDVLDIQGPARSGARGKRGRR